MTDQKLKLIALFNFLKHIPREKTILPKLSDVSILYFEGEFKILFILIAKNIIECVLFNHSFIQLLDSNQSIWDKIELSLQELIDNDKVYITLLEIVKGCVDPEVSKLYMVKMIYN